MKNRKVLIVGNTRLYHSLCGRYRGVFHNIVGTVDIDHIEDFRKDFDFVILMDLMVENRGRIDRNKGRIIVEKEAIQYMSEQWNISRDKILTDGDYKAIVSFPFRVSYGEQNKDQTFWIIRLSGSNGLAAMILRVWAGCSVAKSMGFIPVVDATREYSPYLGKDEIGHVNAWEKFFEQPGGYSLEDIKHSKNIWISPEDQEVRGALLGKEEFCKLLSVKPAVEKEAKKHLQNIRNGGKVLAVKYRGTDYQAKKPYGHPIQPTLRECIDTVEEKKKEWGYERIFLMTESQDAILAFNQQFGNSVCYIPGKRISDKVEDFTGEEFEKIGYAYENAVLYYVEMYIASMCDAFISSQCGSLRVILNLNKDNYEHTYIFNLGTYGIDDV